MAQRTALSPGARAGEYEIIRLLSDSGGSALVYYARRSSRLYVLKELYPSAWSHRMERSPDGVLRRVQDSSGKWTKLLQRFEAEAQNYVRLQRSFARDIVPDGSVQTESAYTFYCEEPVFANGTCYLPIATSSGETLYTHAQKLFGGSIEGGSCLLHILAIAVELCAAVRRLHGLSCLHLDLKPDNLFIADGRLKLLDFGSMASMDDPKSPNAFTPGFSAPELGYGREYLSDDEQKPCAQSDVFSICAILYWMLFGTARSEEELYYDWELNLTQLSDEKFPPLLTGCSLGVIHGCLSLLQKGMSLHPRSRHASVAELSAELESLKTALEKELQISDQRITAAAFMERVRSIYAFRNALPAHCQKCIEDGETAGECVLTCRLMNRYFDRRIAPELELIVNETQPGSCLDYIQHTLISRNQYSEALFALQLLNRHAYLQKWHSTPLHRLYSDIARCAGLLGRDDLQQKYSLLAEQRRTPEISDDDSEFRPMVACEAAFDFGGMVEHSRDAILSRWGGADEPDRRSAALDAILRHNPVPKLLVMHGGRYVEGLCLARSEGWREDCEAILHHMLRSTENEDDSFRARTVDNMLHFAIETGNRALFLQTLRLLPKDPDVPESLLRPSGELLKWSGKREPARHVEDWLVEIADRMLSDGAPVNLDSYQYILYLYLQSVNALFSGYLKRPAVKAALIELCAAIHGILDGKTISHPKPLILKHAALIAHSLDQHKLAEKLRKLLAGCILSMDNGVVRAISGGALLAVDKAFGNERAAFDALIRDIRRGVEDGSFREELFRDALTDSGALLRLFRFKHT